MDKTSTGPPRRVRSGYQLSAGNPLQSSANEADIAARVSYYPQVRAHALAALEALQDSETKLNNQFLVDAYQASQGWFRPLQRTAYEVPVAVGVRREIGGMQSQSELAAYQQFASGFDFNTLTVTGYRDRLRRELDLRVQLAIRRDCDDIMRDLPGGAHAPQLPETCDLNLDPELIEQATQKLAAAPGLEQDLTRLIVDIDQKIGTFDRGLQAAPTTYPNANASIATYVRFPPKET